MVSTFSARSALGIENVATGKLFILLEKTKEDRMTIINPDGKVLTVPGGLFREPFRVDADQWDHRFTAPQVQTFLKANTFSSSRSALSGSSSARARSSSVQKKSKKDISSRRSKLPISCEWECSLLTFYKHKIDPLEDTDFLKIRMDGNLISMTKKDFLTHFGEVLLSPAYVQDGAYSYQEIPEKIRRFMASHPE